MQAKVYDKNMNDNALFIFDWSKYKLEKFLCLNLYKNLKTYFIEICQKHLLLLAVQNQDLDLKKWMEIYSSKNAMWSHTSIDFILKLNHWKKWKFHQTTVTFNKCISSMTSTAQKNCHWATINFHWKTFSIRT